MVGVVEEGGSNDGKDGKDGRKASKTEVVKKVLLGKRLQGEHVQLGKGSKVGRKESTEEAGPPWKGLCSGQLLTAQVKIDMFCIKLII